MEYGIWNKDAAFWTLFTGIVLSSKTTVFTVVLFTCFLINVMSVPVIFYPLLKAQRILKKVNTHWKKINLYLGVVIDGIVAFRVRDSKGGVVVKGQ